MTPGLVPAYLGDVDEATKHTAVLIGGGLVVLLLAALWVRWVDHRIAVLPEWPTAVRRLLGVVVVVGPVLFVGSELWVRELDPRPVRPVLWVGLTWVAFAFYLTLGVAALTALSAPLVVLGRHRDGVRRVLHRVGAPLVVVGALAVTGYGLVEAGDVRVVRQTVASSQLPAEWDGARVVLVTDLHVGPVRDASWTRRVVDLVNAQHPDLVLLGGDLVDGRDRWVGPDLAPLADLEAPLGVYGVSGNHEFLSGDADAYLDRWSRLDVAPLRNEAVRLDRGGATVQVVGLQDHDGTGDDAPDVDRALSGVPEPDFTMLLVHEPRQVVAGRGVDLQLSGHTHGGQLWPFGYAVRLQQPTLAGYDVVDGVPVVTSRGAGAWGPPVRVLAPSDITVVTLRRTT